MLCFHFLVFPFVKKDGSFLCKHRWTENEKSLYQAIGMEPLQQNHWKVMTFFLSSSSSDTKNSWEFKQFIFSLVRFYHIRTINTVITVFSICTGNIASVVAPTSQAQQVVRPRQHFLVQIGKTVIIALGSNANR